MGKLDEMIKPELPNNNWDANSVVSASDMNAFESAIKTEFDNNSNIENLVYSRDILDDLAQSIANIEKNLNELSAYIAAEFPALEKPGDYINYDPSTLVYQYGRALDICTQKKKLLSSYVSKVTNYKKSAENYRQSLLHCCLRYVRPDAVPFNHRYEFSSNRSMFASFVTGGYLDLQRSATGIYFELNITLSHGSLSGTHTLAKIPYIYAPSSDRSSTIKEQEGVWGGKARINDLKRDGRVTIVPLPTDRYKSIKIVGNYSDTYFTELTNLLAPADAYEIKNIEV